jgi:hypothetical protein
MYVGAGLESEQIIHCTAFANSMEKQSEVHNTKLYIIIYIFSIGKEQKW